MYYRGINQNEENWITFIKGANAAILVYDITNLDSFENVKDWVRGKKKFKNNFFILYRIKYKYTRWYK